MFNLESTPYVLENEAMKQALGRLEHIEERVALLRKNGTLSSETVRDYYGEKRFEQVAESNAIEGSTLSVGETELAVLKGVTITGHDPAFVRDAMALDRALNRIADMARDNAHPTGITRLQEIHKLILGDRPGAGLFRREPVRIRGARHLPPRTWQEIMDKMECWESWSTDNHTLPAPLRCVVLQAWLAHIHPYIDGNGRVSRAVGNLELIRAGYPPIIIKKKERERYIDALAESDEGGDIRSFLELVFDRLEGSLTGLESSAKRKQGYDPIIEKLRGKQRDHLVIWETGVKLFASILKDRLSRLLEPVQGTCLEHFYDSPLDLDDYIEVCAGRSVQKSWAFRLRVEVPAIPRIEKLAFIGHRSNQMFNHLGREGGPSIYWSSMNRGDGQKWLADGSRSPYANEVTAKAGSGDEWFARMQDGTIHSLKTTDLADRIARAVVAQLGSENGEHL